MPTVTSMSRLTRATLRTLVLGSFLVPGLVACGGDDDDGEPLTDDEFVEQGNQICTDGSADMQELADDLPADPSNDDLTEFLLASIESLRAQLGAIDDLDAPDDKQDAVGQLVDDAEGVLDDLEDQVNDDVEAVMSSDDDPFEQINEQFADLGLTECAA